MTDEAGYVLHYDEPDGHVVELSSDEGCIDVTVIRSDGVGRESAPRATTNVETHGMSLDGLQSAVQAAIDQCVQRLAGKSVQA